ncbi:MAG: agmatinase [Anaerovoracaceae bacterium]|jgi:agmatinase
MKKYYPVDSLKAPKFCGIRTFMRLPYVENLEDVDMAFVGIPFDTAGSYRTGQRFGPAAIRDASVMVRRYNPIMKVNIFDHISGIDYGDLPVVPGNIEETYRLIEEGLMPLLDRGIVPVCLGGDHSITLGELRAVAKKYGPVALVHFDSHADTDDEPFGLKYNHGTPFRWAIREGLLDTDHSISVGIRGSMYHPDEVKDSLDLGLAVITAEEMRQMGLKEVAKRIKDRVDDRPVFFTFDIDFVDPAYAPGTGTIEVEGFTSHETLSLIRDIKDLHFVAFDIVEMLPEFDPTQITANLASHVGYEFASIMALHHKNKSPYLNRG